MPLQLSCRSLIIERDVTQVLSPDDDSCLVSCWNYAGLCEFESSVCKDAHGAAFLSDTAHDHSADMATSDRHDSVSTVSSPIPISIPSRDSSLCEVWERVLDSIARETHHLAVL
jgi:hypothetical protein